MMPMPEAPGDLPYILQWAPSVHHNGWLTEKSENLMRISGNQIVVMNTADAGREGLSDGQMVRIENSAGAINACVKVGASVNQGELLVINSFSQNPVNCLMKRDKMVNFVRVKTI
jgi:predicted molibdopterin-dependent oxidoreductase YjgC